MEHIKNLVVDEDNEGCTPLHYACRQGVALSVNNLLSLNVSIYSKSRDKKSPLHFAARLVAQSRPWNPCLVFHPCVSGINFCALISVHLAKLWAHQYLSTTYQRHERHKTFE